MCERVGVSLSFSDILFMLLGSYYIYSDFFFHPKVHSFTEKILSAEHSQTARDTAVDKTDTDNALPS